MALGSVFFDVPPPSPATWLYFSAPLAIALFFLFTRLFSIRNLDVLTLYLFAPGLLLLGEASRLSRRAEALAPDLLEPMQHRAALVNFWGYVWLAGASLYFLLRCLADLAFVRRPALGANLNLAGLSWLAGSLFVTLIAVAAAPSPLERPAAKSPARPADPVGEASGAVLEVAAPGVDSLRLLAVLCNLSVVVGLALVGWRHFGDVRAGMSAATFYLLLPYTFLLLPESPIDVGRWDHAWPMALVVWTIFTYRRPALAAAFLGVAAGTSPILLCILPTWLSFYRGRGMTRFLLSFVLCAVLSGAVLGGLLWLYGKSPPRLLQPAWVNFDWQPWKEGAIPSDGLWKGVHVAYRAPVFIASLALMITAAFWPNPKNLAHVLALSAAVLLSVQFWYADRGGTHLLWFLPLLLLLVFRPNLSASEPPVPPADDWVARLGRGLTGQVVRLLRLRRKAAKAPTDEVASQGRG